MSQGIEGSEGTRVDTEEKAQRLKTKVGTDYHCQWAEAPGTVRAEKFPSVSTSGSGPTALEVEKRQKSASERK